MSKETHKNPKNRKNNINAMKDIISQKSEYLNKKIKSKENLSSNLKNENICNTIRTASTKDLILYIQNNNNINNNYTTYINDNNSFNKMRGNTKKLNKKRNYLDVTPLKLVINTDINNNNKEKSKGKQNLQLLIDIMNSNSNEGTNKKFSQNFNDIKKIKNKIDSKKINQVINNNNLKYSNTEIYKSTNEENSNLFLKNNNINSSQNYENNGIFQLNRQTLNKNNKSKNNRNKLLINCPNSNNLYQSSTYKYYNNVKTSSNCVNNYFKIKNMNLHFLNEVHHSPTEINILTTHSMDKNESAKKLKKNISGDSLLKYKIKQDLNQIKKNKE